LRWISVGPTYRARIFTPIVSSFAFLYWFDDSDITILALNSPMAYQRHPQSFRGLVRERLAHIESEFARGIDHATVLAQLGVTGISGGAFRDALYEARRRARSMATATDPTIARQRVNIVPVEAPVLRAPVCVQPRSIGASKPTVRAIRDFLSASKSFRDEEIIGRKSP
jgi:hypothetical protein